MSEFQSDEGDPKTLINRQLFVEAASVEACARSCFLQLEDFSDICKSFDFVLVHRSTLMSEDIGIKSDTFRDAEMKQQVWQRQYITSKFCVLNSMTLVEANQSEFKDNLIRDKRTTDSDEQTWHFELRETLAFDQLLTPINQSLPEADQQEATHGSGFGQFLLETVIVLSALASGYLFVAFYGKKLSRSVLKHSDSHDHRTSSFDMYDIRHANRLHV